MADGFKPKNFQFSLALLLGAVFYAGALATVSIRLVGKNWSPLQIGMAYGVTIACVVGFAVLSKARGKVAAYLLISPLIFVASVVTASMFSDANSYAATPANSTVPMSTTMPSGTVAPIVPSAVPPALPQAGAQ